MPALDPSHKRWVESYAARAHRRLRAVGCSTLQVEDVQQECWVAYCKARDTFRADGGASFSTYLYGGMALHLKRWMDRQRLDAWLTVKGEDAVLAAEARMEVPEPPVAGRERVLERMSRVTRRVVELAIEPPAWLEQEMAAMQAKVRWCRGRGFPFRAQTTTSLIMSALGLTPPERMRVHAEMRRFASAPR